MKCSETREELLTRSRGERGEEMMKKNCLECGKLRVITARGLCWTCYGKPEVRERYPSKRGKGSVKKREDVSRGAAENAEKKEEKRPGLAGLLLPDLIKAVMGELVHLCLDQDAEVRACTKVLEDYAGDVRKLRGEYLKLKARRQEVAARFAGDVAEEEKE